MPIQSYEVPNLVGGSLFSPTSNQSYVYLVLSLFPQRSWWMSFPLSETLTFLAFFIA